MKNKVIYIIKYETTNLYLFQKKKIYKNKKKNKIKIKLKKKKNKLNKIK
jgi:hypothetical protein